jgi:uncharacterized SAM-binding protein YcdF (DUF218 family)
MVLLVTDVFLLLTQVLLWILVGLAGRYLLLQVLPKAFLGGLVLLLLVIVCALTFFQGSPQPGLLGDIWQVISLLFNPLGLLLIFLLIVWRDAESKGIKPMSRWLLRIATVALLLMSTPIFSSFLAQRSEAEAIQLQPTAAVPLEGARRVIVLLAQDTTRLQLRPRTQPIPAPPASPAKPRDFFSLPTPEQITDYQYTLLANQPIQLTDRGNRLTYAAQVYGEERAAGTAPLLVVSAGPRSGRDKKGDEKPEDISEARDVSTFLQNRLGVPAADILEEGESTNIHDSAVNVRKLLQARTINVPQLVLVTSALDMSRAKLTFANEFGADGNRFNVIARPTDFLTLPQKGSIDRRVQGRDLIERNLRLADLLPSADALSTSARVVNEYITSVYYFLRGWVRPLRP